MSVEFNSYWFQAADGGGRFVLERGPARIALDSRRLAAELYASDGSGLFASFEGTVAPNGKIVGTAKRTRDTPAAVALRGYHFQRDEDVRPELHFEDDVSILLTDGFTTIGIVLPAAR